jgi:nucleoside phosphorylase
MKGRLRRLVAAAALVVSFTEGVTVASAASHRAAAPDCAPRLLVLSAFPTELGPLLARTEPRGGDPIGVGDHTFYLGTLGGHRAVLTLTGIGPLNARRTTHMALSHFQCAGHTTITGIVFSGVAGGDYIGDVNAATRWTEDGKHFTAISRAMEQVARRMQHTRPYTLSRDNHAGDPLCIHLDPETGPAVAVTHTPTFRVGGTGLTTDPFSGRRLPCFPYGGDIFGCRPCQSSNVTPTNPLAFLQQISPFVNPGFFTGYSSSTAAPPGHYVSSDEETAEVAKAARDARVPFIGFRGVSDGGGDPLHLPGFPFQFFVYRQLSADNVGAVAAAFIQAWHDRSNLITK